MQKSDILYIYIYTLNKHTTLLQELDVHGGNQNGVHLNP